MSIIARNFTVALIILAFSLPGGAIDKQPVTEIKTQATTQLVSHRTKRSRRLPKTTANISSQTPEERTSNAQYVAVGIMATTRLAAVGLYILALSTAAASLFAF
jgi:hypothetical protein